MSKNGMIGAVACALAGMQTKHVGIVEDVANRLNGKDAEIYHSRFAKALREKLPKGNGCQHKFLKPVATAVTDVFSPQELTASKDIWLSPEFIERILSVAENFQPTDDIQSPSGFDIVELASDREIRSELPNDHVFEASEFCWRLKMMTRAQPEGKKGDLLNNGYANIFYVRGKGGEVFAVHVSWDGSGWQWDVRCCRLDGHGGWLQGGRAFSRN